LTKASEVILCDNEAKNTGIAIAMVSIFNEVNVQKNKLEWSSYFLTTPKLKTKEIDSIDIRSTIPNH